MTDRRRPVRAFASASLALGVGAVLASCGAPSTVFDGRPIPLSRSASGGLLVVASAGDALATPLEPAAVQSVLLDTGSSLTFWNVPDQGGVGNAELRTVSLLAPTTGDRPAVRAVMRGFKALGTALSAVEATAGPTVVAAVLGGDALARLSLEFQLGPVPTLSLWDRLPATDAFLSASGYAVLRVPRSGGGQVNVRGRPDFLSLRGPYEFPATRLVVRACAGPDVFDRNGSLPETCCEGDDRTFTTGIDLALVLGTGFGRTVLARSSWERVRAGLGGAVSEASGTVEHPTFRQPIPATIVTIGRLALVDQESSDFDDPGPCVELGRSRRLEQIALRQKVATDAEDQGVLDVSAPCAQPCDQDTRAAGSPRPARNSAGYVELGGTLEIAVVDDQAEFLQFLREEIRPEGPDIDGVLGASTLSGTRLELVYRDSPSRLVFSCLQGDPATCRAVGRCPRLPGLGQVHNCYGIQNHRLPRMCDNPGGTCP